MGGGESGGGEGNENEEKPPPVSLVIHDHTRSRVICQRVTTELAEAAKKQMRCLCLVHPVALVNRLARRTEVNMRGRDDAIHFVGLWPTWRGWNTAKDGGLMIFMYL